MPIKIFLSSKVNPVFEGLDRLDYTLGDLRKFIKKEFEGEKFLGQKLIQVVMNEEGFEATFDKDAFDSCLENIKKCDLVVVLFNGDAGWAPDKDINANGICHEEYLQAANDHPSMTVGINITKYFSSVTFSSEQQKRNDAFMDDVNRLYRFKEYSEAKTVDELQTYIKDLIQGYIKHAIDKAFEAKKQLDQNNTIFGKTLDWNKLSYAQREKELKDLSSSAFKDIFPNTICLYHGIPDHLSVADARNSMGRPFLHEHVELSTSTLNSGAIHFITVYGNATETQIKSLIGFPDVTLIKTTFGFYLWEQTTQIQIFVSSNCINPNLIKTRRQQIINWLKSSNERSKIKVRADERYKILDVIVKAIAKTK